MRLSVYTSWVLLTLLVISRAKVPELSVNSFDGSLFFVQVYEDGCQSCNV